MGNKAANFSTLGARNYSTHARELDDYYCTPPVAVEELLKVERFSKRIWECACGGGHISKVLEAHGYEVYSTDLVYRDYGVGGLDFLAYEGESVDMDIVTNPPYAHAKEFVEKAVEVVALGHKVAMLQRIQFLESISRRELLRRCPPKTVYVFTRRIACGRNGVIPKHANAMMYAWMVWEKGWRGDPVIKWVHD